MLIKIMQLISMCSFPYQQKQKQHSNNTAEKQYILLQNKILGWWEEENETISRKRYFTK